MRYRVTVPVTADLEVDEPLTAEAPPYRISIAINENRCPRLLSIERVVEDYRDWLPTVNRSGPVPHIHVPDNPMVSEFRDKLEYPCAIGSYWFGFLSMDWGAAEHQWIPDSPEQLADLPISQFQFTARYPPGRSPHTLNANALRDLLSLQERLSYLTVPMSFWRAGMSGFSQRHYVVSYLNFYLYIESIYAGGHSRTTTVVREYQKSRQLVGAVTKAHALFSDIRHGPSLRHLRSFKRCEETAQGTLRLLVLMRGSLAHCGPPGRTQHSGLVRQEQYESLAYLAMMVSIYTLMELITGQSVPS